MKPIPQTGREATLREAGAAAKGDEFFSAGLRLPGTVAGISRFGKLGAKAA
jgi:hypothetical protein